MNNKDQQQEELEEIEDHKSAPSDKGEEEEDFIYLDEEEIQAMDQDDDFNTINESEIGDPTLYDEG